MKSKSNGKPTYTTEEMTDWISRFRRSGMGLKRFAQEHQIPWTRLHYWIYQKPGSQLRHGKTAGAVPLFQELKFAPGSPLLNAWAAEVSWPTGMTVRLRETTSSAWIRELFRELKRSC